MSHQYSAYERFMSRLIPAHFATGRFSYHVKVLITYSLTVGSLALLVLAGLMLADGGVAPRRLVTVSIACLYAVSIPMMRFIHSVNVLAWYVILVSLALIGYVDFNNQSLAGPSGALWLIPLALTGLVFKGGQLVVLLMITFSLFLLNATLFFKGLLPAPIIQPESWTVVSAVYLLVASVVVYVCTSGMAKLAHDQMDDLQDKLDEKQKHLQEINDLKIKAEASTSSKTMFLATMSHELRTPLNSVIGNAQLLVKETLPATAKTRIEDIMLAGKLLLTLINDILDLSKMEQNKLTLIETNYDLNAQVINLARMMESRAQEGVELHVSLPEHPVIILADQSRLAQVIMNFLSNAFKFTAKGHVTIHVNALHNGDLELSVSDTGSGIDEGDINKLFTQFSQVTGDSAKNIEGTGLGLAICKSIIEQMGGQIDVSSMIDQGSCFSIYLPNRIQHHSQETLIQEDNYELNLEDISILIVDDIAMNCIVLEGMLEEFGANKVSTVNSGEHAIAFIKEHAETAIVLMDVRMPIMTGMEATVLIREMGFEGIIIAVTANASAEDESDCLASGMNYFLAKPIELDKLKHLLNQALT